MRAALLKVSVPVIALALVASAAHALPEDPPGAHLRYRGEVIQRAPVVAQCWPAEDGGMGCGEKSPMPWPKIDRVDRGSELRLRIHWKREPNRVFVHSYRDIHQNGKPRGDSTKPPWHKEAVRRDGEVVAWDIVFRLLVPREHYITVLSRFPETVVWSMHVRAVE